MENENLEKLKLNLINKISKLNRNKLLAINNFLKSNSKKNKEFNNPELLLSKKNQIKKLSVDQIRELNEQDIKKLSIVEFMEMSETQFNAINKDLIKYIPYNVFIDSNKRFLINLNKEKLLSLSIETIGNIFNNIKVEGPIINSLLTDEQAYYLVKHDYGIKLSDIKNEYVRVFINSKADNYLQIRFSKNKLKNLKISDISVNNFGNIPVNKYDYLTQAQYENMTPNQIQKISNNNAKMNKVIQRKY